MIVIVSALCWDKWLGEPHVRIHPVVWMGNCIAWMRKKSPSSAAASFLWGLFMVILLPLCFALLAVLSQIPLFGIAFAIWKPPEDHIVNDPGIAFSTLKLPNFTWESTLAPILE